MMPRKNGKETYDAIQKITPGSKVIFISGYSADVIQRKNILKKRIAFYLKTYFTDRTPEYGAHGSR